ncbi:MAG: hypothetical protein HDT15_11550 [Oscillibacter sp.]|nr:hypothetical protein [Oscillibacter sp.]
MPKGATTPNSGKPYHMMYVQQLKHLPAGNVDNLVNLIDTRLHPKEYALIVHDQDEGEEPHVHCMFSFQNGRSLANVAKLLGDKPQYIEKWNDKPNNGFAYLIHATAKAQSEGKYQYDPSAVKANFDYVKRMAEIRTEIATAKSEHHGNKKIHELLNLLYVGAITQKEVEQQLTGVEYAQHHKKIEDVWAKRLQNMADAWRAEKKAQNGEITTIWLYGPAGTGKTSLAKENMQKSGEEYYISGSSRDIFQGYSGEHKMILDELRPESMPYQDLLRITDPHGIENGTIAPSRYYDKALACDLIIVTSPYNPKEFYTRIFGESWRNTDKFDQLERRIALTVKMTEAYICKMEYDKSKGTYEEVLGTQRPNTYSTQNRPKVPKATEDIYGTLFGDVPPVFETKEEEAGSISEDPN